MDQYRTSAYGIMGTLWKLFLNHDPARRSDFANFMRACASGGPIALRTGCDDPWRLFAEQKTGRCSMY
jgi:hypothetical protein